ncbi:MAG: phosphate/phosphite/phosphonate ABC transporter substrate-binding protein [Leptonema sp. (in: bacteria)]
MLSYINLLFLVFILLIQCSKQDIGFSEPTFIYDGYPLNVQEEENPIYFTIVPYRNFIELSYNYKLLFEYLSEKTKKKIIYFPLDEYYKIYFMLETEKISLAIVDPYIFFKKNLDKKYKIFAKPKHKDAEFNSSVIVTRNDKPINSIDKKVSKDLSISFDNLDSFFGYHIPLRYLENQNISVKDFKKIYMSSNFENTVQGVLSGNFDLGCIDYLTFSKYKAKGIGLKLLYQSESYEHFPIIIHKNLDENLQQIILKALLAINIENNQNLLKSISENLIGFSYANTENYKNYK